MKKVLLFVTLICSTLAFSQTGKNFIDQNYIEVTGKSEMEIAPDMIYLKILISENDTKNKISVSDLEAKMADALEKLGVDLKKDLAIKDYSSNYKFYLLGKTDIMLTKEYQLLVHDGQTVGKVFRRLEEIGISNISIDKLDHSKITDYRMEVKVNTMKAAKEKAHLLASAIDQEIGKALLIEEQNFIPVTRQSNSIMIRGYSTPTSKKELDIDFEKIKLEYSVLCRFALVTRE